MMIRADDIIYVPDIMMNHDSHILLSFESLESLDFLPVPSWRSSTSRFCFFSHSHSGSLKTLSPLITFLRPIESGAACSRRRFQRSSMGHTNDRRQTQHEVRILSVYQNKHVVMVMSSWVKTAERTHPGLAHILCFPLLLAVWVTWTLKLDLDYDGDVSRKPV